MQSYPLIPINIHSHKNNAPAACYDHIRTCTHLGIGRRAEHVHSSTTSLRARSDTPSCHPPPRSMASQNQQPQKRIRVGVSIFDSFREANAGSADQPMEPVPDFAAERPAPTQNILQARMADMAAIAEEFPDLTPDERTFVGVVKCLVADAKITNYNLLKEDKLGIYLAVHGRGLRGHDYRVFHYKPEFGVWAMEEMLPPATTDVLLAAEGVLISLRARVQPWPVPLQWSWPSCKAELVAALNDRPVVRRTATPREHVRAMFRSTMTGGVRTCVRAFGRCVCVCVL